MRDPLEKNLPGGPLKPFRACRVLGTALSEGYTRARGTNEAISALGRRPAFYSEAQRQDLEYFSHYISLNRVYTAVERKQVASMLVSYQAEAGKMTPAQFELAISRMVALSDNGHSEDHPYLFRSRFDNLPCLLYHFSDGYYIVRARPICEAVLGGRLVAIDGHAIDEV